MCTNDVYMLINISNSDCFLTAGKPRKFSLGFVCISDFWFSVRRVATVIRIDTVHEKTCERFRCGFALDLQQDRI